MGAPTMDPWVLEGEVSPRAKGVSRDVVAKEAIDDEGEEGEDDIKEEKFEEEDVKEEGKHAQRDEKLYDE